MRFLYFNSSLFVKFLVSQGMEYVLTELFNQDPVEVFFGQQRSKGDRCDNPSAKQFLHNTQAIMVQKSLACGTYHEKGVTP